MSGKSERLVAQAKSYRDPLRATLTASDALQRLDELLEDLSALSPLLESKLSAHWTLGGRHRFEIVDYYLVAAVTCLEWHARARLKDALTFNPESVVPDDLSGNVAKQTIVDAVKNRVPIQDLIAASLNVSSLTSYLTTMERVAQSINIKFNMSNWLSANAPSPIERYPLQSRSKHLDYIFSFRNKLVHEVRYEQVGPWRMRDGLQISEVAFYVRLALETLQEFETQFAEQAPPLFPKAGLPGLYMSEREQLHSELSILEDKIRQAIRSSGANSGDLLSSIEEEQETEHLELWNDVTKNWNSLILVEAKFLEYVDFLFNSSFQISDAYIVQLQRFRYEYLKSITRLL